MKPPKTPTLREKKEQNRQSTVSKSERQEKYSKTDMIENKKAKSKITEEHRPARRNMNWPGEFCQCSSC